MNQSYCPSCYRDLPRDSKCLPCAEWTARMQPAARFPLWIGSAGLPLLIFGLLGPSHHACMAGAILSGCGALAHVILTLREA